MTYYFLTEKRNFVTLLMTIPCAAKTLAEVVDTLVVETRCAIHWFEINKLAVNPAKFQVMFLGTSENITHFNLGNIILKTSDSVKLKGFRLTISYGLRAM